MKKKQKHKGTNNSITEKLRIKCGETIYLSYDKNHPPKIKRIKG